MRYEGLFIGCSPTAVAVARLCSPIQARKPIDNVQDHSAGLTSKPPGEGRQVDSDCFLLLGLGNLRKAANLVFAEPPYVLLALSSAISIGSATNSRSNDTRWCRWSWSWRALRIWTRICEHLWQLGAIWLVAWTATKAPYQYHVLIGMVVTHAQRGLNCSRLVDDACSRAVQWRVGGQ